MSAARLGKLSVTTSVRNKPIAQNCTVAIRLGSMCPFAGQDHSAFLARNSVGVGISLRSDHRRMRAKGDLSCDLGNIKKPALISRVSLFVVPRISPDPAAAPARGATHMHRTAGPADNRPRLSQSHMMAAARRPLKLSAIVDPGHDVAVGCASWQVARTWPDDGPGCACGPNFPERSVN